MMPRPYLTSPLPLTQRATRVYASTAKPRCFSSSSRRLATVGSDHYKALGLPRNATRQQVKAKFYELSKEYHPDAKSGDIAKFHEINDAYATLGDEAKRRQYDSSSAPAFNRAPSTSQTPFSSSHSSFSPNDPYLHRAAQGPHRSWSRSSQSHTNTHSHGHANPRTEAYSPFGRRTSSGTQYAYEYNYHHVPNSRTTDRSGWGRRKSEERQGQEVSQGGGGIWRFIIAVGMVLTITSLGGGLIANSESLVDWGEYDESIIRDNFRPEGEAMDGLDQDD